MNDTQKKALLSLLKYTIFFIIVISLILYSPNEILEDESSSTVDTNTTSYITKQKVLYEEEYSYICTISGTYDIKYNANVSKDAIDGIKTYNKVQTKYLINNTGIYKYKNNKKEEYYDLYKNIDSSYFDFKDLFSKLNSYSTIVKSDGNNKIYTYNDGNIKVITDSNHITDITIIDNNLTYNFEFTY